MASPITKIVNPHDEVGGTAQVVNNVSATTIYQVTSGRKFYLKSLIITNLSSEALVSIYDSTSSSNPPIPPIKAPAQDTVALGEGDIHGATFISSVIAYSTTSGVWIHVGGYEI